MLLTENQRSRGGMVFKRPLFPQQWKTLMIFSNAVTAKAELELRQADEIVTTIGH